MKDLRRESGQVVVIFAIALPLILAIGSIVLDLGNWYVHKRHLQTQVDAAALAGGQSLYGCLEDFAGANTDVEQTALSYAGDLSRAPSTANPQVQNRERVHVLLNSPSYWSSPTAPNTDYQEVSTDPDSPKIGPAGRPCYNGWIDVKATDDNATRLWGLIPFSASPKTVARVELSKTLSMAGVLPLGLPDVNPTYVAAILVDLAAANWQTNANAVRGSGLLCQPSVSCAPSSPPTGTTGLNVWQGTMTDASGATVSVDGSNDFGVFVLMSLGSSPPILSGSLDQICGQNPVPAGQVECFAYDGSGQEVSFIHAYPGTAAGLRNPQLRDAPLSGGCDGTGSNPLDLSRPYFNLNGGCPMTLTANIDFNLPPGNDPTRPPPEGVCARVTSSAGTVTNSGSFFSVTFTPPDSSTSTGRYPVSMTARTFDVNGGGNCNNTQLSTKTWPTVAAPYISDQDGNSGPIQYLTVQNGGATGGIANSINQNPAASLWVTVALTPPIADQPLNSEPVMFRLGDFNTPSQTQALDCGASGAAGWRQKIVEGCPGYSVNERNGDCSLPYPNPNAPDCIASETGQFSVQNAYRDRFIPKGCALNPNNWGNPGRPPVGDPRWATLFVVDRHGFTISGKKYYPIRKFVTIYVTAGDGLGCPTDYSAGQPVGRNELWGHITSYVTIDPDATAATEKCSFTDGGVCVPVLVK